MDQGELVEMLVKQNERLIEALVASSPIEVLKALNPPPSPQAAQRDPWAGDPGSPHQQLPEDSWGDPSVPLSKVLEGPWVTPPFNPEGYQGNSEEVEDTGVKS